MDGGLVSHLLNPSNHLAFYFWNLVKDLFHCLILRAWIVVTICPSGIKFCCRRNGGNLNFFDMPDALNSIACVMLTLIRKQRSRTQSWYSLFPLYSRGSTAPQTFSEKDEISFHVFKVKGKATSFRTPKAYIACNCPNFCFTVHNIHFIFYFNEHHAMKAYQGVEV